MPSHQYLPIHQNNRVTLFELEQLEIKHRNQMANPLPIRTFHRD